MSRLLCAVLMAVLLLTAQASAATRPPRIPRGWVGVAVDGPLTAPGAPMDAEWDRMAPNGVGFVRAAFYWRYVEPQRGSFDFTSTDAVVLAAARRGLRVLPDVLGTPGWAALDPHNLGSPPSDPADYAAAVAALAGRYGPEGTFWPEHRDVVSQVIRSWQLWNEPNITAYWSRQPFARRYVALLRVTRAALRRVDLGAQVVLGGMPNKSWLALRSIYRAGGRGTFDAIALHPYTSQVRYVVSVVRHAREEAVRARDAHRPIWLTEVSWPASAAYDHLPSNGFEVTDKGQATRLTQTLVALARVRRSLGIAKVVWYTWLSAERRSTPRWSGFSGLRRLRPDGTVVTAPALAALRRTVAQLRR